MNIDAMKVHRLREIDVAAAAAIEDVIPNFLHFIGGRPLVGYYLDFDINMVNKYLPALLGIELPNPRIEVSKLYYDRKYGDAPPGTASTCPSSRSCSDLDLPWLDQHDAFNDALMTAMMYVALRDMKERDVWGIARPRAGGAIFNPIGG